ncbi:MULTISPECIES: ArsR family transcriptional regulator [Haloferax]|uniref:ArsR family transcriptional regulator n=2 Tax=Haloferax TaxID=2251 RepID=A0A6G1Z5W7_9EURY|nr:MULTISPECIES: ArsR family transcriptional regulator [Haloferax]KAB1185384.1 ArsR family transcriptional regulator [Haloferax sp. CBA1149]MRW82027.1 ArsR family transcriptional regulator [Haloferax marinisediminis]
MARETLDHETTTRTSRIDDVFEALSNPYRRQLLFALEERNRTRNGSFAPFEVFTEGRDDDGDGVDSTQIELVHVHLPKLSNLGFIDWNRETNEISTGSEWNEIEPLLQLLLTHRDELPVG